MKRGVIGFLAVILSTQYSGAVDVSAIESATSADGAITEYTKLANARVDTAESDTVPADEISKAREHIKKMASDAATGDIPSSESDDDDDDDGSDDSGDTSGMKPVDTDGLPDDEDKKEKSDVPTDEDIAELRKNYEDVKANEQSAKNRMIGAAGIGGVGIGGMQLAQGLTEKKADEAAEQDMKAYLATFTCRYGEGKSVRGGTVGVELPGGNDLTELVTQYKELAADLKMRKEALGMMPGIESEVILDKATAGLYDDEFLGRNGGAYTSVANALLDENSEDAAEWAAQKADAQKRIKTGAIVAGVGAVGSLAANLIANRKSYKEQSAEIIKKYKDKLSEPAKKLEEDLEPLDQEPEYKNESCPSGTRGTPPDCDPIDDDKNTYNGNSNDTEPVVGCVVNGRANVVVGEDGNCTCTNGYMYLNDVCTCPSDTHTEKDGKCNPITIIEEAEKQLKPITLSSHSLFDLGKYNLKPAAKTAIANYATSFKTKLAEVESDYGATVPYCISIAAHTDKTGSDATNKKLSANRANAVRDELVAKGINANSIRTFGFGPAACKEGSKKTPAENCRKVTISTGVNSCDGTTQEELSGKASELGIDGIQNLLGSNSGANGGLSSILGNSGGEGGLGNIAGALMGGAK